MLPIVPVPVPTDIIDSAHNVLSAPLEVDYELCPARPMPQLDLSIATKSWLFSPRALKFVDAVVQHPVIRYTGFIGAMSYLTVLFAPVPLGRVVGVIAGALATYSILRYDVVRVLLTAFDIWLAILGVVVTFVTLSNLGPTHA